MTRLRRTAVLVGSILTSALGASSCSQVLGLGDFYDALCAPGAPRACYDGPDGTESVGICKGGKQTCADDGLSWGACVGEVVPTAGDTCGNQLDDDCNGVADDHCLCKDGDKDCVGQTPRVCTGATWVAQPACGDPTPLCSAGDCVACADGEVGCDQDKPTKCVGGNWVPQAPCTTPLPGCRDGVCVAPSCQSGDTGAGANCGPTSDADCCGGATVPGGTFNRSNDPMYGANISAFGLDVYEVTVGRFRAFMESGRGTQANPPMFGSGAHLGDMVTGWDPTWTTNLAADTTALKTALKCDAFWTWTDVPATNERLPINCVTWYEAFAFCAWDGGWLPSEPEWNYAAAGGDEQRMFPWGAADVDDTKAAYTCEGDGMTSCMFTDIRPVGDKSPAGDAKWGHADMGGNATEWVMDSYVAPYAYNFCVDCVNLTPNTDKVVRGGGYNAGPYFLWTSSRSSRAPGTRMDDGGFRCARLSVP